MWSRFLVWVRTSRVFLSILFIVFICILSIFIILLETPKNRMFQTFGDGLWWSIVTLTTTGYGDLVPSTRTGRIIASVLMLVGIVVTSVFSGYAASLLVERRNIIRRGLMNLNWMKDHIVICGWRGTEMPALISRVLSQNKEIPARNCIIISSISPKLLDEVHSLPDLQDVRFIHGETFSDKILKRANVGEARKVIVVPEGESLSVEHDSRVVMTVLAIRNISRSVYIVAELYETQYYDQVRLAYCDEVIFLQEFNRDILAGVSNTIGLSNILLDLLSQNTETHFGTEIIPNEYISQTFGTFKTQFDAKNRILLGILEHSGNPLRMKLNAIREAQKTASTTQLIDNLVQTRQLKVHAPVFLPEDAYIIKPYSRAMYIERK